MRYTNNANRILCNANGRAFATLPIVTAPPSEGWNETPSGGAGAAKAVPDWNTLTYESALDVRNLTFNGNNEIIIDGRNIQSLDSSVAAISLWHPSSNGKKIIIRNCVIRHAGKGINGVGTWAHIEIQNCFFLGMNATNDAAENTRRAISLLEFRSAVIEHNHIESNAGIELVYGKGIYTKTLYEKVTIRFNRFKNIDGRMQTTSYVANTVQIDGKADQAGVATPLTDIGWNETVNEEGKTQCEDNYNFFNCRGTAANPIRVHHNYVSGAFYWNYKTNSYTGGGIITDSPGSTQDTMTAYLNVEYNRVVRTMNYCYGMATCRNTNYRYNRFIAASKFADGTDYTFQVSGMWAKEYYPASGGSSNNAVHGNYGGTRTYWNAKLDYNNIADGNGNTIAAFYDNTAIAATVTTAHEQAEQTAWNAQLAAANVTLGPIIQS
jgi:hypothetical protein